MRCLIVHGIVPGVTGSEARKHSGEPDKPATYVEFVAVLALCLPCLMPFRVCILLRPACLFGRLAIVGWCLSCLAGAVPAN